MASLGEHGQVGVHRRLGSILTQPQNPTAHRPTPPRETEGSVYDSTIEIETIEKFRDAELKPPTSLPAPIFVSNFTMSEYS